MSDYRMSREQADLARRAANYLKTHGLIMVWAWKLEGEPPEDVADYIARVINTVFPEDDKSLRELAIGLIEEPLALFSHEEDEPVSEYAPQASLDGTTEADQLRIDDLFQAGVE